MWIPEMSECQVSQTHVKRPKNIFMQEIFLMQQQNIWLELEMNRFTMIARLVRLNRDLVSGWVVVTKKGREQGKVEVGALGSGTRTTCSWSSTKTKTKTKSGCY